MCKYIHSLYFSYHLIISQDFTFCKAKHRKKIIFWAGIIATFMFLYSITAYNVNNTKNNGPKLFKKYLEYVKYVSEGDKRSAKVILNSLLDSDISRNTKVKFDSPFEEEVYKELVKRGLSVDTQIGVSGYKIDLGIYDEITSKYKLGIECDGSAYHSSKEARERDIHRQRYLESRGWKIYRIWSSNWWKNPDLEINKIITINVIILPLVSHFVSSIHILLFHIFNYNIIRQNK